MWLLESSTYKLREFIDSDHAPPYAILSHTWEGDEVSFRDVQDSAEGVRLKAGFVKIRYLCEQALQDGVDWVWVDTCCIDKSSSAELSEAINSMYAIYAQAVTCYVYMVDVPATCVDLSDDLDQKVRNGATPTSASECSLTTPIEGSRHMSAFRWSRWFTRGWTLQELLAPPNVDFRNVSWGSIGPLHKLVLTVSDITGVGFEVLLGGRSLEHCCVAEKFSWASFRATSRIEDQAYCLLGLFGVNMPLLYGERQNAFKRLQEELIKTTSDTSILAWHSLGMRRHIMYRDVIKLVRSDLGDRELGPMPYWPHAADLLASSVADFSGCGDVRTTELDGSLASVSDMLELDWAKSGLKTRLPVLPIDYRSEDGTSFGVLLLGCDLITTGRQESPLGLLLQSTIGTIGGSRYSISADVSLRRYGGFSYVIKGLPLQAFASPLRESILTWTGDKDIPRWNAHYGYAPMSVSRAGTYILLGTENIEVLSAYPTSAYNDCARVLLLHSNDSFAAISLEMRLSEGAPLFAVLVFLPRLLGARGSPVQLRFTRHDTWPEVCSRLEDHVRQGHTLFPDSYDYVRESYAIPHSNDPRTSTHAPFEPQGDARCSQYVLDVLSPAVTTGDSLMPFPHIGMFLASCQSDDRHANFVRVQVSFLSQQELTERHADFVEKKGPIEAELQHLYTKHGRIWHQPDDWTEDMVRDVSRREALVARYG